jgi:hypothetical protein
MPLATDYLTSDWLTAKHLKPETIYEATIIWAGPHTFENGETKLAIRIDYQPSGIAMNQTRLTAMISAFGPNYDNRVGKTIQFWQGDTFYQGRPEKCVAIKGVVAERIAAKPIDIRSGKDAWREPSPPITEVPDGPDYGRDADDGIPF